MMLFHNTLENVSFDNLPDVPSGNLRYMEMTIFSR
jgi:hypothetical protein